MNPTEERLAELLSNARAIALVGPSPPESARRLEGAGVEAIQDPCIKRAHARLPAGHSAE